MRVGNFGPKASTALVTIGCFLGICSAQTQTAARFSGSYAVEDATVQGDYVHVILKIRIVNGSDKDSANAVVILSDLLSRMKLSSTPLLLRAHSSAAFNSECTISRPEYERWRRGVRPTVAVQTAESAGRKSTVFIRLVKSPAPGRQ